MRFFSRRRRPSAQEVTPAASRPSSEPATQDGEIVALKKAALDPSHHGSEFLRAALAAIESTRLAGVSHEVRASYRNWVASFEELEVGEAQALINAHPDKMAAAAALSMHHNGRIRQLCVRAMHGSTDPFVVPFLLLRCGEWIEAVRHDALAAVDPWVHVDHAPTLLRAFPLLGGARFARSRPTRELPQRIESILQSAAARPALLATLASDDPTTIRTAIRMATADGATVDLLKRALATGDAVSIALVARGLPMEGEVNAQTGVLLWRHPTARLRQEGVYRLLKHGGSRAESVALEAMKDRSEAVRSTATRWLQNHGADTAALYRSLSTKDLRASLLGLGDHPDEQDAVLARSSLDERPAIRRAALRLLAKLGLPEDQDVFINAFMVGSGRERRTATGWFRRAGITPNVLASMWSDDQSGEVGVDNNVRILQQLVPMASVWHQIDFALRATSAEDPTLKGAGLSRLRRLAYQSSGYRARPDAEHLDRLRASFELVRPRLDSNLAAGVDQLLRP